MDGRQGREAAAAEWGLPDARPGNPACPVLAAHLSEVPVAIGWVKCFLFRLPTPLTPVCSSVPMAGPERSVAMAYGLCTIPGGLLRCEMR